MDKFLRADNISKIYKKREVVKKVSIEIKTGETVALLGPNGAGKTTTFYMIVGIISTSSGKIYLNEKNISNFPVYKRAKMGIGYLPQEASVFRKLTVEENLMSIFEMHNDMDKTEKKQKCDELLEDFNISYIRKSYGYQLSGGERRRVEIARALVNNPSFLLLDEPFAGVDPIRVQDIQNIVVKLKNKGIGVLITDHKVKETLEIVDRAYMLNTGNIFASGTAKELAENEIAKKIYLGDDFKLN